MPLSQSCAVAKISGGPLAKQTWQRMEDCYTGVSAKLWKPLLRSAVCMQSFDCPVAHQNILLLATAHDCYPSVSQVSVKVHLINNCFISYTLFVCLFVLLFVCLFVGRLVSSSVVHLTLICLTLVPSPGSLQWCHRMRCAWLPGCQGRVSNKRSPAMVSMLNLN